MHCNSSVPNIFESTNSHLTLLIFPNKTKSSHIIIHYQGIKVPHSSIIKSLSPTLYNQILLLLDKGLSAHQIFSSTGVHTSTISRLYSKHYSTLSKSAGGHPAKLSPSNIWHTIYLITSRKAETAIEISKTLANIINQPLSTKTIAGQLKKTGMKAMVKKKRPLLTKRYKQEQLHWAISTQELDCGGLEEGYMVR
jgi:Transposase